MMNVNGSVLQSAFRASRSKRFIHRLGFPPPWEMRGGGDMPEMEFAWGQPLWGKCLLSLSEPWKQLVEALGCGEWAGESGFCPLIRRKARRGSLPLGLPLYPESLPKATPQQE